MSGPETIETGYAPIKAWVEGVPVEEAARRQLFNVAAAARSSTATSRSCRTCTWAGAPRSAPSIPTRGAIIPAAVGVDIGCGMMAVRTTLTASDLSRLR